MKLINTETISETQRLLLEPLKLTHAVALYQLLQDKRIYEYIPTSAPASLEILEQRYQKLETRLSPDGSEAWLNWAVYIKEYKAYAGYIEATVLPGVARIAYILAPQFWKQGYAYEACKCLISILWRDYNITEIIAEVDTRNLASFRLLERLGFTHIETRKNADFFKGVSSDEYIYRLSNS
ncbi:putative acetyltransferase [Calothrix sp. NIES-4071]|nr:putative acetyltransferase [Calothrix sp. NIES-4071]BAZ57976.1 putative acetyltransferase [Calothrix sp. NIES-4105]